MTPCMATGDLRHSRKFPALSTLRVPESDATATTCQELSMTRTCVSLPIFTRPDQHLAWAHVAWAHAHTPAPNPDPVKPPAPPPEIPPTEPPNPTPQRPPLT